MYADRRISTRRPGPTLAAADRPVWAIFHARVCRVPCCSTPASSSGGRLSFSVGRQKKRTTSLRRHSR
jgi:hypothetical protein